MLRHFFHRCRVYFELDHRQAKAYAWLLLLTVVVVCSPAFTYYLYPLRNDQLKFMLDTLMQEEVHWVPDKQHGKKYPLFKKEIDKMQQEDWVKTGLPVYLAKRIVKYQISVKKLTSVSDLYVIYGMDSSRVQQVMPYLENSTAVKRFTVSNSKQKTSKRDYPLQKTPMVPVDINTIDSLSLEAMPTIGPVLTKRILKYRALLNGYVSKEQYSEIYGISPEALEVLTKRTIIHTLPVVCSLRTADYTTLNAHFYLSGKDARFIVTQLKSKKDMCWEELKEGLEPKAQQHLQFLMLYYPCE